MTHRTGMALVLVALAACGTDTETDGASADTRPADTQVAAERPADGGATALASDFSDLSPEQIEAGRLDSTWRRHVEMDPDTAQAQRDTASRESWDDIAPETVNGEIRSLPVHGDVEGPAVARIQILLDQAAFSPGVIDGRWGKNTEKAVYWFQKERGLSANGKVDRATLDALQSEGEGRQVRSHTVEESDISGPFQELPDDVYERADQPCLCYESQREQLGEVFHSTPEFLEQLNPDVDLNTVSAGQTLQVPAVGTFRIDELPDGKYTEGAEVARIVISDGGNYLHALDDAGNILYHFPSTLGADYSPSPTGDFEVESITFDPTWHYQPDILTGVDPSEEEAVLPAGPNNAVGVVWMALSKPHYGIHGTKDPASIGYATSNGCVRLTNWDAAFLAQRIPPGVAVEFTDVER